MQLRSADFHDFFYDIHDQTPFPWQQALVDRLAECDRWPDVLDLPTGAGKTAAMDVAIFHLALRADKPGRDVLRKAALRIALVVDRRLVVDDAFDRASKISKKLRQALCADTQGHEVVKEVASRLCQLAGDDGPPLIVRRLRGGAPLEDDWARTPTQPTILCSTVDQIGSRLLFRGYGVSDRMKPIHAGLLGTDSLILLDEAHLSEPFRQTLAATQHIGRARVRMALLSATPGAEAERLFELSPADRAHPVLRKRLEAHKHAVLKVVRGTPVTVAEAFAKAARAMADRLREKGVSPHAIGIVVNRVALARSVFNALKSDDTNDATLMIGRSRDVDRDRIAEKLDPFRTGAKDRLRARPLFIVATQCLEVGVDLDLDGLVTQAASLDALRQRFGRLNRAGRPFSAEGTILACPEDIAKSADDPVYGDRIHKTWEELQDLAKDGPVDFGAEALSKCLNDAGIDQKTLAAERSNAPVIMPAYLDLWSQTSPRPAADPDIGLFLHGAGRAITGVSIVWRGDISQDDLKNERRDSIKELLRLVPPRASEAVDVPLWVARAWLRQSRRDSVPLDAMSDAPERECEDEMSGRTVNRKSGRPAFRWGGADDAHTGLVWPDELRPEDMLIVPSEYGGCDRYGWNPDSSNLVEDVADDAAKSFWGRRCAVRVARGLVPDDILSRALKILKGESTATDDRIGRLLDVLPFKNVAKPEKEEGHWRGLWALRDGLKALQCAKKGCKISFPYDDLGEKGAVIVAKRGIKGAHTSDVFAPATESDDMSHTSEEPVSLEDHSCQVARYARRFAQTLDLDDSIASDLELAAYLHDAGKADPRFQVMLSGGDSWNRPEGPPLAKSGRSRSPDARKRAGLPEGWRHEALSVRMATAHPRFKDARNPALVLWLIGSHHGLGRPFFGFFDPEPDRGPFPSCLGVKEWRFAAENPGPQSLAFEFRGADWPSLFEDLKRCYGIWGLAHMEAILRLADHRASEEERVS